MKIHHFGFLTLNIDNSIKYLEKLGYELEKRLVDDERIVELALLRAESGEVLELIMPLQSESVVSKISKKLNNTIYHICYLTTDIEDSINQLEQNGFFLIDKPKPAILFDNRKVAFLQSKYAGMIELLEE
jgi:methylmalonyl-CoA/ethylmalonyl-CoA epimerase